MKGTVSGLQRIVGIGGSVTLIALICLGYPIYLTLRPEGSLLGFALHDTTLALLAVLLVFAASTFAVHRSARIAQVLTLILFGYLTLASAVLGALTGLAIASIGVMLAAHYGYLRNHTRAKAALLVIGALASLAIQAFARSADAGLSWTALQFSYNAVGVLGLAAGYLFVLRDAAASASKRQAALQEAVDERTRALSREIESRKQAEKAATEAARTAERLAVERLDLLREVHHRAKNSLQMTLTLLEMSDSGMRDTKATTINRVRAIGLAYDLVDSAVDLSSISLQDYLGSLVSHVQMSTEYGPVLIEFVMDDDHRTRIEPTISFGIAVHEIVSLICTYAFQLKPGAIALKAERRNGSIHMEFSHQGDELPEWVALGEEAGQQLGLLPALLDRLHCEAHIERGETTVWRLLIPADVMTRHGES